MVPNQARDIYGHLESQTKIHPVKLIHMLFERVLIHLDHAEEGIRENSPRKRGENLGKAVAIISELNGSVSRDDKSEAALFLRGLYEAILVELPKVSVNNDTRILQRSREYIEKLKEVWEQTAMVENGLECRSKNKGENLRSIPGKEKGFAPESSSRKLSFSI
ncbi:MAG: flagellar export chaperone FliS [Proteobacteria bacterium]|nr:flagellar export chaperone FliS [Pseudomonadota bacterium]MBU1737700.1 flagellar export chaperone FliS [Pseudomonadota bacterium]